MRISNIAAIAFFLALCSPAHAEQDEQVCKSFCQSEKNACMERVGSFNALQNRPARERVQTGDLSAYLQAEAADKASNKSYSAERKQQCNDDFMRCSLSCQKP